MPFDGEKKWGGKYAEMMEIAVSNYADRLHDQAECSSYESEIEAMLSFSVYASHYAPAIQDLFFEIVPVQWGYHGKTSLDHALSFVDVHRKIHVISQVLIEDYVVDFLCVLKFQPDNMSEQTICVAIECDGHDFHEKTKEQAARDKRRDRVLLMRGFPTMRFAGSEVWKDAFGCVKQIDDFFFEAARRLIGWDVTKAQVMG